MLLPVSLFVVCHTLRLECLKSTAVDEAPVLTTVGPSTVGCTGSWAVILVFLARMSLSGDTI